jgi:hypothetical protein
MLKATIKKILLSNCIEKKLGPFYRAKESGEDIRFRCFLESSQIVRSALAENNIWLFSQMKSGTTFFCNAIAFYNAACDGIEHDDFDDLARYGVLRAGRSGHVVEKNRISEAVQFIRNGKSKKLLVHSHNDLSVNDCLYVLLTRNPFDICVSSYFYHYKYRNINISFEEAVRKILKSYQSTYRAQQKILEQKDQTLAINYESLVENPKKVISEFIFKAYGFVDHESLEKALDLTTVEKVKAWEERAKKPLVVWSRGGFNEASFIRSGKVGEYEEVFSEEEISYIRGLLNEWGLPEDGKL